MATKKHTCFTVTCDICGEEYQGAHDGIPHFGDPESAAQEARDDEWAATDDAARAVCPAGDEAHDAAYTDVWTEYEAQEAARAAAPAASA